MMNKYTESMREILRHPRLNFDRSFSERGTRQLVWLACAIVIVFTILFLLSYLFAFDETDVGGNQQMGRLMRLITLFIDPGAIESMLPSTRTFAIIVSVTGLVMMTGMFISVLTNMLDVHIDKVKNGETHYALKGHVVVIGMDDLVPSLINQICNEAQFKGSYILVQSTEEAENVRSRIRNVIDKGKETRIIIYRGKRNSLEDLQALCIPDAKAVFLIGEPHETDKDSMNIESLRMISELCGKWASKRKTCAEAIPVAVQFEHQATFAAFQVTDLSTEWRKHIDFQPFNFHESWAKKVFVTGGYTKGHVNVTYPPLDREPITFDSQKTVHLIIVGMGQMGVAMGTFAAHLLHFPNFCRDHRLKSLITFIDANADKEMNAFRNRYRGLFEISSAIYRDFTKESPLEQILPPTRFRGNNADFLDLKFEFIKGAVESPCVQDYLSKCSTHISHVTTIALSLSTPSANMAIAMSLPNEVYERKVPVLVRIKSSDALLTMLNQRGNEKQYSKYSNLYPYGMLANCYDMDHNKLEAAKLTNYYYSGKPTDTTADALWKKLSVALQWSNLYNAYSKDIRRRSFGLCKDKPASPEQIRQLCMVEHNRWCMEKLLLGYRKPNEHEQQEINRKVPKEDNGEKVDVTEWYKKRFVHNNIVPNEQLTEEDIVHDKDIIMGLIEDVNR